MTWKYGHKKHILMDGTFGVCSTCVWEFFLMVVDKRNVGIPVGSIIFTPWKDAKAGHASYDGPLLKELLGLFKEGMGTKKDGELFHIQVANTDKNSRKHFALVEVWPVIFLLFCLFHTWQAWHNGLTWTLCCIPKGPPHQEVWKHLGKFLMWLLKEITDYPEAIAAYNQELSYFWSLSTSKNSELNKKKSQGGVAFLAYLNTYLHICSLSKAGVLEAACILSVPAENVPRTTNHLQFFNSHGPAIESTSASESPRLWLQNWLLCLVSLLKDVYNPISCTVY